MRNLGHVLRTGILGLALLIRQLAVAAGVDPDSREQVGALDREKRGKRANQTSRGTLMDH
jgi:hypothetical protein